MTAAHVVSPDDENRHPPDAEDLWNESYYADFVHEDGTWGGWLRLGLYPNRDVAWWTTWIVGIDRPGVCSVRYDAPVPAGTGLVSEDAAIRIGLEILEPLERFRITASAPAEVFEHPEAVYTGESGTPAQLDLDLTWTTDGTPYHYDVTTRYEIPCTVAGTVRIDGTDLTIRGQGQRDHSWGVRDWWAVGWCWSSARLDDGTRVHLADIRFPGFPVALGYVQTPISHGQVQTSTSHGDVQTPMSEVHPISTLAVSEELGLHGLPTSARIEITYGAMDSATVVPVVSDLPVVPVVPVVPDLPVVPVVPEVPVVAMDQMSSGARRDESHGVSGGDSAPLVIDVTPLAFGPVLLRNDDGRTSRFPRAMVSYNSGDGRRGLGWIEWNQPDGAPPHRP